ncbi:ATP-binding protein [Variovorax sp. J22P271]|uniref:ATP-binding protein n=1 Tax=Variovorax davisae TaxID=3053515 RepID=UPI002578A8A0|nr:ATP-binding protein [Variovorax sp. J22P271]MDM0037071.1 ATP-binding protein [Variovorax sp. J22P271]
MIKAGVLWRTVDSGTVTMVLACVLGIASYFFGQPMAIELHWFSMALISLSIVALVLMQYLRTRARQRLDDQIHAILDAVPHVLFFKDTALRYQVLNTEFERAFGMRASAAIGKNDLDLFGAALHDRFVAQDRELIASGQARSFDEEIVVGGVRRSYLASKRPVRDRRGKLYGIVGVVVDVTEQKQLQRELEVALGRLSIALDAAGMGTWEVNLSTDETHADARARKVLGMKEGESGLSAAYARVHPDDAAELDRRMAIARQSGEVMAYEFRIVDDSGAVRWVEGFSSPNRGRGEHDFLIGINRDITERRLGELALSDAKRQAEQSQANLALALTVGGLGVWRSVTRAHKDSAAADLALGDTVITADPKIREIVRRPGEVDICYRDLLRMLPPEDRYRAGRGLRKAYRRGHGAYRDQIRLSGRDGELRTLDVRGSVTTSVEAGAEPAWVTFTGIVKDITREEALKADLTAKAEEARAALDAKRQFLAMMSHEVRTPLTGVLGTIDLVIDTPLTDEQRAMLMRSREASVALLTIINDILDFSKIEARKLELEHRPLSLHGLVEDICLTLAPDAQRKAIGLTFDIDPRIPPFIVGDAVRLRQILTNLIGNALKFTKDGGVAVAVRRPSEATLELSVEDTGIGIDPAAIESLFEPFRQADIATTRRYGGTGLGLTIVRQLVDLMGGSVRCESQLNQGSRFIVTLPLRAWTSGADAAPTLRPGGRAAPGGGAVTPIGQGRRLLFAEDHELNREVITMQLAKLGFTCDCAEDGEQAWERLTTPGADYALLLTDCHMPRLDGYDLARRVRAREAELGLARLPIVALTANALQGEAERCRALGMDGYLSKPLQLLDLRDALAEVLDRPAAPAGEPAVDAPAPAVAYPALAALCGGDLGDVAQLLGIFITATRQDLEAFDAAVEAGDHVRLRQLAHRLCSACHQLDEAKAVRALRAVEGLALAEGAGLDADATALCAMARGELVAALARAEAFARAHAIPA